MSSPNWACMPETVLRPFSTQPSLPPVSQAQWLSAFPSADHWTRFPVQNDPIPMARREVLNEAVADRSETPSQGPCDLPTRLTLSICEARRAPISRRAADTVVKSIDGQPLSPRRQQKRDVVTEALLQRGGENRSPHPRSLLRDAGWTAAFVEEIPDQNIFRQWTSGKMSEAW